MQRIFQINAFASDLFTGNPALVCPLDDWLDEAAMQRIAAENGLTTAFFVGHDGRYRLRWFAPKTEIEGICGHGTLAAAYVILNELGDESEEIAFDVPSGELRVRRHGEGFVLDLPALEPAPCLVEAAAEILGREPDALMGALDLIAVFPEEEHVAGFEPDLVRLAELPLRAAIVTAPGREVDFVSRWFAPKHGEGEDAGITGSAHCSLVPYWAKRLGKTKLRAHQLSPRGGTLDCELRDGRALLTCSAVKYMEGHLHL